jgi:hypothetical protein
MATRYEVGFQSAAAAAGAAYCAIRMPTAGKQLKLLELWLSNNAATLSNISLFRNTNGSYAASTSTTGQKTSTNDGAATGVVDTAWSAAATITAANRGRRFALPATAGAGMTWVWQNGLWILGNTLTDVVVVWNEGGSAGSALNGTAVWEES